MSSSPTKFAQYAFAIALALFSNFLVVHQVLAKDVVWSSTLPHPDFFVWAGPNQFAQMNIQASVRYTATVRNLSAGNILLTDGSSVSVGDQLQITVDPFQNNDVTWTVGGTGNMFDQLIRPGTSRQGYVNVTNRAPAGSCVASNVTVIRLPFCPGPISWFTNSYGGITGISMGGGTCPDTYTYVNTVGVDIPGVVISGSGLSCSGNTCTVTATGPISVSTQFQSTNLGIHNLPSATSETLSCVESNLYPTSPALHAIPPQAITHSLNSITPLAIPTPTATPGSCGTGQISVSWSPVAGATSYDIQINGGSWTLLGNVTSYNHTGLGAGSANNYVVRARNVGGPGAQSGQVNVSAPAACATGSCSIAPASWDCYRVSYAEGPYAGQVVADACVPVGTPNPDASGCVTGPYAHDVQFLSNNATIPGGFVSCATNCPTITIPPAPTGLTATPNTCGTNQLFLDWDDVPSATSYSVYFSNGTFVGNTIGSNYTFTGGANLPYSFYVRANSGAGQSANSTVVNNTTPVVCPSLPNLLVNGSDGPVQVNYNTVVNLTWTSTHPTNCTLSGAGVPGSASVTPNSPGGGRNATITQTDTYILTCGTETDIVQVNLNAQAPNAPTVNFPSGSTAGLVGSAVPFRLVSTHSNPTSQFYYTIDWDNNGSADTPSPSPTYTSGQQWTINNTWLTGGTRTVRACARDIGNTLPAACTNHTVTITLPPPPSVTLQNSITGVGGPWTSSDPTINPNNSLALRWVSTGASSCTATAGNGFSTGSGNPTTGTDPVTPPTPGTNALYTVSCTGLGGTTDRTITVTTRAYPNLTQPDITYLLSPTFNSTTGAYDYIDVTFQTRNDGGSDTLATANYEFQFDQSRNGYEYTTTGSIGLLTVSQAVNRTERVSGSISFGNVRTRVFVDNNNAVTETNEGDNVRVFDFVISPPNPGLNITVSRPTVRGGETVTINWNTGATYPMNCSVLGPGIAPAIAFDPSVTGPTGTRVSQPITAKSEFTLRCFEPITGTTWTDIATVGIVGSLEEI